MLLLETVEDGNEGLCDEVLELARDNGRADADSIRQCYYMIAKAEHRPKPLVLSSKPPLSGYASDLSVYDRLSGTGTPDIRKLLEGDGRQ